MKENLTGIRLAILILIMPFGSYADQLKAQKSTSTYIVVIFLILLIGAILVYYKVWKDKTTKVDNTEKRISSFRLTQPGKQFGNQLNVNKKDNI